MSIGAPVTPAIEVVQRRYECSASGDLDTMRDEILAPNVVWRIPGRHPLSGPKHGAQEILAFFSQLAKAGMQAEVVFLAGDDTHAVDMHRGWRATDAGAVDQVWVLCYRNEGGRIAEVVNLASDQAQADEFFWHSYRLAPLPGRLARP